MSTALSIDCGGVRDRHCRTFSHDRPFMNIGNLSSSSTLFASAGTSATAEAPIASDADDPNGTGSATTVRGVHRHGGGHMGHAIIDALQSLGLSVPQPQTTTSGADATSAAGDAQPASAAPAAADVRSDFHAL